MSSGGPHLLLANPAAGGGRVAEQLPEAEAALRRHGVEHRVVITTSVEHGREEAERALERRETVLVMSGDGLIGQVGGVLCGSGVPLGIIPGGRGNDLARVVGIPTDLDSAAALIAKGETRTIDLGEANGERFICIASAGFDSEANRIANETRIVRGNLVYLYAALRALAAWKPARFTLTLDGRERIVDGYAVAVANSKAYGGGMFVAPDAVLDDGLFDVVWTEQVGKLRFLSQLPKVFKGAHIENPEVHVERAAEVRIEADRPFVIYADGDPIADVPATIRVIPGALELIAPAAPPS